MWNTIILNIVLSFIIIFASHQIWEYCKSNYTTHKTKNLADVHASKYKTMMEDMERSFVQKTASNVETEVIRKNASHPHRFSESLEDLPDATHRFISEEEKDWIRTELAKFIASAD